jgi:hypothetical protein
MPIHRTTDYTASTRSLPLDQFQVYADNKSMNCLTTHTTFSLLAAAAILGDRG